MKSFDHGVGWYATGYAPVHFPEGDICCAWCPALGVELKSDRKYCKCTGEFLASPNYSVGLNCPIKFEEEEENGNLESL